MTAAAQTRRAKLIREVTRHWSDAEKAAALARLETEARRVCAARNYPSAGALALALDPDHNIQVPWLEVLDRELEEAFTIRDARLMVSVPSQEGKSTRAVVWGAVRALILNPSRRIIVVTHSEELALSHSERIRNILQTFGTGARDIQSGRLLDDKLGIGLGEKTSAGRWTLAGHEGGVVAVGVGTALPGKPCDLMILDDLHPSMLAADSPAEQRKVRSWWDAVGSQRLAPGAPVIAIGTRWSTKDIFSYVLEQEPTRWKRLNFPAIAQAGILDSLNREPGVPLASARGERDWAYQRKIKPARVWAATYQGSPVPVSGGMFSQEWFDNHRIHADIHPALYRRIVAIDPADSGVGDLTGIVGCGLDAYGNVIYTHDESGLMTSDKWATAAVQLAIETGAGEIVYEAYSVPETYRRVLRSAIENAGMAGQIRIIPWKGTGNAAVRSTGLQFGCETGKARMWQSRLADLEADAVTWLETAHCPDRVAAAVVAYDHLAGAGTVSMADPLAGGWGAMPTGLTG